MTTDTARENSGAIANNFDKDKVQSEINLQVEVTRKFDQNRQEVKAEINKKIDQAKSENQSILDKQEGGIPLSREEEQQLAAYNKKVENYQQLGVLLDVVTSGLSSPTSSGLGIAASSLSPAASYEIGQYFKEKGTEGSSAHILAHTVLGAAVAAAGGNDALTAGLVAGGAEAAAPALSSFLYNKKPSDLTADEKSTISAISAITGLVATGVGGIASGDIATAVQSGQGAQNAVENNYLTLGQLGYYDLELGTCGTKKNCELIIDKYRKISVEQDDKLAELCSKKPSQCRQVYAAVLNQSNNFKDEINEFKNIPLYDKAVFVSQEMSAVGTINRANYAKELQKQAQKHNITLNDQEANIYASAIFGAITGGVGKGSVKATQVNSQQITSGSVATRINIANGRTASTPLRENGQKSSAGMDHVITGHFNQPIANSRSIFTLKPNELKSILQDKNVVSSPVFAMPGGQYVRTVDTGKVIGVTSIKEGGKSTTFIKIFTDVKGNLITTYPVKGK